MNELSEYEKMSNNLKKLGLSEADFSKIEKYKWVVTEKIHGANFSFVYENGNLKFAKRKNYLSWTDDFFGFQLVASKLENKIIRLFEYLSAEIPAAKYIIYGELFGGKYPHPEVSSEKDIHAIQTGVYYTPLIDFCAFDIAIETKDTESKYYLDFEKALQLFSQFEIFHVKPLFIGKLNETLNFNTRINSLIPQLLGLPELKENLIEGVVIKPYNYNADLKIPRPVVKLKNPEFDEEKKFHEAEKWSFIPNISSNSESLSFIMDELRNYITHNRLQSAISKIGSLTKTDEVRVMQIKTEFLRDVIADFNENNNNLFNELSADEQQWLEDRILFEINKVITLYK